MTTPAPSERTWATARDLLRILTTAATWTDLERPRAAIDHAHLTEAIEDYRNPADPVTHERIALMALDFCTSRARLPWRTRTGCSELDVPPYVAPLMAPDGHLDGIALRRRLFELGAM